MRDDQADTLTRLITEISDRLREIDRRSIRSEQALERIAALIERRLPAVVMPIEGRVS